MKWDLWGIVQLQHTIHKTINRNVIILLLTSNHAIYIISWGLILPDQINKYNETIYVLFMKLGHN